MHPVDTLPTTTAYRIAQAAAATQAPTFTDPRTYQIEAGASVATIIQDGAPLAHALSASTADRVERTSPNGARIARYFEGEGVSREHDHLRR